jgi:hypothetical protein
MFEDRKAMASVRAYGTSSREDVRHSTCKNLPISNRGRASFCHWVEACMPSRGITGPLSCCTCSRYIMLPCILEWARQSESKGCRCSLSLDYVSEPRSDSADEIRPQSAKEHDPAAAWARVCNSHSARSTLPRLHPMPTVPIPSQLHTGARPHVGTNQVAVFGRRKEQQRLRRRRGSICQASKSLPGMRTMSRTENAMRRSSTHLSRL